MSFLIAIAVAFGAAFAITLVMGVDGESKAAPAAISEPVGPKTLVSPVDGVVEPLSTVNDETFASGVLGGGCAIVPAQGVVYAPADSTLTTVFPTGHALGLHTNSGLDILIHIGMLLQSFVPSMTIAASRG